MQKIFLCFLISLILIPSLYASEIYFFEDFSISPQQKSVLYEHDAVTFNEKGGKHTLILEKVREDSIDLSFFIFQENRGTLTLRLGNYVNVDVDRDFKDDFKVTLNDFSFDLKKAMIGVETLPGFYINVNENIEEETKTKNLVQQIPKRIIGLTLTILIIVVGLIIFYLFKKFNH